MRAGTLSREQLRVLFRACVPGFVSGLPAKIEDDLRGVDFWLTVAGEPYQQSAQLKVRDRRVLSDLLIEFCSVSATGCRPGWISDKPCNWFCYFARPAGKCLILDGWELRAAWSALGRDWLSRYGVKVAMNPDFASLSAAVPLAEIFGACLSARVVEVTL